MTVLELMHPQPRWEPALAAALSRPPGIPERRAGEDPWRPRTEERPRRIADDLAWLRQAIEDPVAGGLRPLDDRDARVPLWEAAGAEAGERLERLLERGVLLAAGFELHRADMPPEVE